MEPSVDEIPEPPILSDITIDALELEANGYVVVSQEYLRRLEAVCVAAATVVAGETSIEALDAVIRGSG